MAYMPTNAQYQDIPAAKPVETDVNRRIVGLMWDRKITQTALAVNLGLTQSGLSKKLHGRSGWGVDELATVARVLRTTMSYLFGEDSKNGPAGTKKAPTVSGEGQELLELDSNQQPIDLWSERSKRRGITEIVEHEISAPVTQLRAV